MYNDSGLVLSLATYGLSNGLQYDPQPDELLDRIEWVITDCDDDVVDSGQILAKDILKTKLSRTNNPKRLFWTHKKELVKEILKNYCSPINPDLNTIRLFPLERGAPVVFNIRKYKITYKEL